jgi:hypothetical protein
MNGGNTWGVTNILVYWILESWANGPNSEMVLQ